MKLGWLVIGVFFVEVGCMSPPHTFVVTADAAIVSSTLELSGKASAMKVHGRRATGSRHVGDSAGKIVVAMENGKSVECPIGYITNGEVEPHRFVVTGDECKET